MDLAAHGTSTWFDRTHVLHMKSAHGALEHVQYMDSAHGTDSTWWHTPAHGSTAHGGTYQHIPSAAHGGT